MISREQFEKIELEHGCGYWDLCAEHACPCAITTENKGLQESIYNGFIEENRILIEEHENDDFDYEPDGIEEDFEDDEEYEDDEKTCETPYTDLWASLKFTIELSEYCKETREENTSPAFASALCQKCIDKDCRFINICVELHEMNRKDHENEEG